MTQQEERAAQMREFLGKRHAASGEALKGRVNEWLAKKAAQEQAAADAAAAEKARIEAEAAAEAARIAQVRERALEQARMAALARLNSPMPPPPTAPAKPLVGKTYTVKPGPTLTNTAPPAIAQRPQIPARQLNVRSQGSVIQPHGHPSGPLPPMAVAKLQRARDLRRSQMKK